MKKKEFKVIAVIVIIMLLILTLVVVTKNGKNNKENNVVQNSNATQNTNKNIIKEEFVKTEADGTKVNTSNKLKKDKTFDGLTLSNISIQSKDNETNLVATVKNPTNNTKGDYSVKLIIKDKDGNTIKEIFGYINSIEPKGQTSLKIKTSYDFANAYDFEISKD